MSLGWLYLAGLGILVPDNADSFPRPFPCAGVGRRPLSTDRKTPSVTEPAVAIDCLESL